MTKKSWGGGGHRREEGNSRAKRFRRVRQNRLRMLRSRTPDEQGVTLQTVIITAVLALAATGAGIVIYNAVGSSGGNVSENAAGIDGLRSTRLNDVEIGLGASRKFPNSELYTGTRTADCRDDGSTASADVDRCIPCPLGRAGEGGICAPCLPNTVAISEGLTECMSCPTGFVASSDRGACCPEGGGTIDSTGAENARCNPPEAGEQVAVVSVGSQHACAVAGTKRQVYCWGSGDDNILTGASSTSTPVPASIQVGAGGADTLVEGAVSVSAGRDHTCAVVDPDGQVYCWGRDLAYTSKVGDNSLTGAVSVSAGDNHTCAAADPDGSVYCWGDGSGGQLCNENTVSSGTPIQVLKGELQADGDYLTGAVSVSAGGEHTCAVVETDGDSDTVSDRVIYCWGTNFQGQLGTVTGDTVTPAPVRVTRTRDGDYLTGAVSVSAGGEHTCAVVETDGDSDTVSDRVIYCWGTNNKGELGGEPTYYTAPVQVLKGELQADGDYLTGAVSVSAGGKHTCAVVETDGDSGTVSDRVVYCWGDIPGLLTNGESSSRTPVAVGLTGAVSVSTHSNSTCAITELNKIYCWSVNADGLPGGTDPTRGLTPVEVRGADGTGFLKGVSKVSAGTGTDGVFTCAVADPDGSVYCWGANSYGQLGDGTTTPSPTLVKVKKGTGETDFLTGAVSVSAGDNHTCAAADPDGSVYCWGGNSQGQLGDGTTTPSPTLVKVKKGTGETDFLTGAVSVSAGDNHTCAVADPDGSVYCWGDYYSRQQSDSETGSSQLMPFRVLSGEQSETEGTFLTGAVSVSARGCAIANPNNTVYCWGVVSTYDGSEHQRSITTPVKVKKGTGETDFLTGAVSVSAGDNHTCAVADPDGSVYCWGANSHGQLGRGNIYGPQPIPLRVLSGEQSETEGTFLTGAVSVSAGWLHTCAIAGVQGTQSRETRLYCWGRNNEGQLGDGTTEQRFEPVQVKGSSGKAFLTGATSVSTGSLHTCAVADPGGSRGYCWGDSPSLLVTPQGSTPHEIVIPL